MAVARHYCDDCETHYGGPPNYMSPEEHADEVHDGGFFRGITNGNWEDFEAKESWESIQDRL